MSTDTLSKQPQYPIHIQLSESHEYKNAMPFTTLNDVVVDIRYVPLETNPECLVSGGASPTLTQDFIYIISRGILLQFTRQGKFIRRINRQGKGLGECTVRSFGIDETNRLIHIYDDRYHDIITFTVEGEYVKTLRNPFSKVPDVGSPSGFRYDSEKGKLFFTDFQDGKGNVLYKYAVTDTAGTILYQCPNYTQYPLRMSGYFFSSSGGGYLYGYGSSLYYHYIYNDTIFLINEDYTCSPAYIRHLPNRTTIKEYMEMRAGVKKPADLYGQNVYERCNEDEKYVYLFHYYSVSREKAIPLLSLYEKATGNLIENINPIIDLLNNWDGGLDVPLRDYILGGHQICLALDPYEMKETLTAEHFASRDIAHPEKAESLKKLVSTLKDEDNPVLMLITMK